MKKTLKIALLVVTSITVLALLLFCILYYTLAPVRIDKLQSGDELLKNGDSVYVQKKSLYEKGDIVLIAECEQDNAINPLNLPLCTEKEEEQTTRLIDGLPGETIDYAKEFPEAYENFIKNNENGSAFASKLSLQENQYMVKTPLTKKIPMPNEVKISKNIYGKVIAVPSRNWNEKWIFLKERTLEIPTFIRERI